MFGSYIVGILCFVVYFVLISILLRLRLKIAPLVVQLLIALIVHVVGTLLGALYMEILYWSGAALYWFVFMSYLYIFNAFYKSMSLTIAYELSKQPSGSASLREIYERDIRTNFIDRLEILVNGGQVERQSDRFKIASRGQRTAHYIRAVQKLFGIEHSGIRYLEHQDKS